ncbi:hypothetical protein FQA39_LY12916 [Lamprigera yunnana]|nr:hypothetical protein FQA39_LY12916 [Lamprigera yunnana]
MNLVNIIGQLEGDAEVAYITKDGNSKLYKFAVKVPKTYKRDKDFDEYGQKTITTFIKDLVEEKRIILTTDQDGICSQVIKEGITNNARMIILTSKALDVFVKENASLVSQLEETDYLIVSEKHSSPLAVDRIEQTMI